MSRRLARGVLLFALLLGLPAGPGWAVGARLDADLGFDGYVVPGRWMPLTVAVAGATEQTVVEVIHGREGKGRTVIERFPCPSPDGVNHVECPIFAEETGGAVLVRLVAGDRVLAAQRLETSAKVFPGHLILAVSLPVAAQQAIGQILLPGEPVLTIERRLEELPRLPLEYDGVSALVMSDPGPLLNPAQVRSLRAWLAGGGSLVLCAAQHGPESLVSLFFPVEQRVIGAGPREVRLGLGRVVLVEDEASTLDTAGWRSLMSLPPYARTARLLAGRCFPRDERIVAAVPDLPGQYRGILAGWAGLFLLLCLLARRRGLAYLLVLTIGATCAAVPAGAWFGQAWRRGAVVRTRAVILPADGGIWASTRVELIRAGGWHLDQDQASPWGVSIDLRGQGRGVLAPRGGPAFTWFQRTPFPLTTVRAAQSTGLCMTGWYAPPAPVDSAGQVLWDGESWWETREGDWFALEGRPPWLREETVWLKALAGLAPGCRWLIGRGPLPGLSLTVQGGRENEAYWAKPVP